jgi:hypothetical protein
MELIYSYSVVEEGFVAQHFGRYGPWVSVTEIHQDVL